MTCGEQSVRPSPMMTSQEHQSPTFMVKDDTTEDGAQTPQLQSSPDGLHEADESPQELEDQSLSQSKTALPVQKRRRVTRACDECRRKKIKCDGKQPCTHCTVYSYECTYDQPSTRRRNPAPQYIEALENRLHRAEELLRAVLPDFDPKDPRFENLDVEDILSSLKKEHHTPVSTPETEHQPEQCDESLLESMVDNTGSLDLDDRGHWDYHGHSSGLIFVRRLRKQFGNVVPEPKPLPKFQQVSHFIEDSKAASESPVDSHTPLHDLPSREVARQLCNNAVGDACCVMRFIHKPSFFAMFDRIYDNSPEQYSNEEHTFLPLLYLALAMGCLFRGVGDSTLEKSGYEAALRQGFQYFKAGRQLLDITECRDLTSLQAICFMVLFLQSSANLSTCYSYIGVALRAALRLGLHRSVSANFNPVELETRKRVFWIVRKMDVHVSAIIGLPTMLSEEDIDQEYPLPVEDEYITPTGILPMPPNHVSLMEGVNAHIRLGHIILKVMKYIYPIKAANPGQNHSYMVSHFKIRDIERDLQEWMEALPDTFRPGGETSPDIERMRQLLRVSYAHVQIILYRPFLHYVTGNSQGRGIDKRSYACAAACVSVARNVVHITAGLKKKQLLNGSYWFTMYTTHMAILSLLYFILENPESATTKDGVLKDALEGKNALAGLAKRSMAADRCTQSLNSIFKHLPERLRNRQSTAATAMNRKRTVPAPANAPGVRGTQTPSEWSRDAEHAVPNPIQRANSFPIQRGSKQTGHTRQPSGDAGPDYGHAQPNNHSQPWLVNSHSPLAISQSASNIPSPIEGDGNPGSSSSSSVPSSSRRQPHRRQTSSYLSSEMSFSPPLNNNGQFPDLMPMMFPSDDPFAYPNQPMSTLEDDHFKHDPHGTGEQVPFGRVPNLPTGMSEDAFNPAPAAPRRNYGSMGATTAPIPSHLKGSSTQFPTTQQQGLATPSSGSTNSQPNTEGSDNAADLVAMSHEASPWQSQFYGGSGGGDQYLTAAPLAQPLPQDPSGNMGMGMGTGTSSTGSAGAGFDGLGMGMNMAMPLGMGMDIDDLLSSTTGSGDGADLPIDWSQFGNWDMGDGPK